MGFKPTTKQFQICSMDDDLKNCLWNEINSFFDNIKKFWGCGSLASVRHHFFHDYWKSVLKKPYDTFPEFEGRAYNTIRESFYSSEWNEVYDFVEYFVVYIERLPQFLRDSWRQLKLNQSILDTKESINNVLESEFSGYRFINGKLVPMTNEGEVKQIEEAIRSTNNFTALSGCNHHLTQALALLSDRTSPDFSNSIKESISAVESLMRKMTGNKSFAGAMDKLATDLKLHRAMQEGFKSLYGYTSDSGGIRHAKIKDDDDCQQEDAIYMLVSCSAFINLMITKLQKSTIYQAQLA
jgi:hypothetical protein